MDNIIHQTANVSCQPEKVFPYFTQANRLTQWLCVEANIELKPGGLYELFWQPDDRENNSTLGCRITALTPNQLIAFEWRSPQQFKHFANQADPLTHVSISFIPNVEHTQIHLIHSGWRHNDDWEQARLWQQQAWEIAFKNLSQCFK